MNGTVEENSSSVMPLSHLKTKKNGQKRTKPQILPKVDYTSDAHDTSLLYVGSTIQPLAKRWGGHKADCLNPDGKNYKRMLYQKIRESNLNDWYMELYEECPSENIQQLHKREDEVIREIGNLAYSSGCRTQIQMIEQWI
eukprot:757971-Hanusia_phi.AAC.3